MFPPGHVAGSNLQPTANTNEPSPCAAQTRGACSKCRFLMIRCHMPHHARIKLLCPECAGDAHLQRDARPWQLRWSPTGGAWRVTRDQSRRYRHAGVAGSPGVKGIVSSHDTAICIACSGHGGHFWRLLPQCCASQRQSRTQSTVAHWLGFALSAA